MKSLLFLYLHNNIPGCIDNVGYRLSQGATANAAINANDNKSIEITFGVNKKNLIVEVSPNPNKGFFSVNIFSSDTSLVNIYTIKIFDLVGNLVVTKSITNDKQDLILSSLTKGFYYITLNSNKAQSTQKLIIQ